MQVIPNGRLLRVETLLNLKYDSEYMFQKAVQLELLKSKPFGPCHRLEWRHISADRAYTNSSDVS